MRATASLYAYSEDSMTAIPLHDFTPRNVAKVPTKCSSCNLREMCLPCGLTGQDVSRMDELVYTRRRIERGECLYRPGDKFSSLYAVRSGFFKTLQMLQDGREQVTGFHMAGEIMGMDGIGPEQHGSSTVALEDSEVCVIPYSRLESLGRDVPALHRQFHDRNILVVDGPDGAPRLHTIDLDHLTRANRRSCTAHADHGRDAELARDDGAM